jgi:hypothetical protein
VALGNQIITTDVFANSATCQKVWGRLLSGLVVDQVLGGEGGPSADAVQVVQLLHEVDQADWSQVRAIGEGQASRAEFDGKVASLLRCKGVLVHGSLVVGS